MEVRSDRESGTPTQVKGSLRGGFGLGAVVPMMIMQTKDLCAVEAAEDLVRGCGTEAGHADPLPLRVGVEQERHVEDIRVCGCVFLSRKRATDHAGRQIIQRPRGGRISPGLERPRRVDTPVANDSLVIACDDVPLGRAVS